MNKSVIKFWGSESWIVNNEFYCFKELYLLKDKFCSLHYHKQKDETFIIQSGIVGMEVDSVKRIMSVGESIRIKPNVIHRFTGIQDSIIYEVSTHHDDLDSYRLQPSGEFTQE